MKKMEMVVNPGSKWNNNADYHSDGLLGKDTFIQGESN